MPGLVEGIEGLDEGIDGLEDGIEGLEDGSDGLDEGIDGMELLLDELDEGLLVGIEGEDGGLDCCGVWHATSNVLNVITKKLRCTINIIIPSGFWLYFKYVPVGNAFGGDRLTLYKPGPVASCPDRALHS